MKTLKRVTAFFLMIVMVLTMSCTVFATEVKESQVKTAEPALPGRPKEEAADVKTNHTYKAYQIFQGIVEEGELRKIDWGKGVDGENFLKALQQNKEFVAEGKNVFAGIEYKDNTDATNRSADAIARIIDSWGSDDVKDSSEYTAPNATDGRARVFAKIANEYIIKDAAISAGTIPPDGYYLVVDETEDLSGTVRNLSFLRLGNGVEFDPANKADVPELEKKVKEINDSEGDDAWKDAADYDIGDDVEFVLTGTLPRDYDRYASYKYVFHDTLSPALMLNVKDADGKDLIKVSIDNTPVTGYTFNSEGQSFTITFDNLKNTAAKAGSVIRVEYTAKLTAEAKIGKEGNINTAYLEYSNDPNNAESTTVTPEDKVIVFTYKLVVNKVDEDKKPLENAGFTLYKYNKNSTENTEEDKYEIVGTEITGVTTFEFTGVDAGKYKLVESTVPPGYNRADDLYFTVVAVIDETAQSVTELKVESVTDAEGNAFWNGEGDARTPVFQFKGVPDTGTISTDIVNLSGLLLPATGGIGTTIFYVVGGILVVGAGVLLIAKKRSDKTKSE